jgi:hypothetical protein
LRDYYVTNFNLINSGKWSLNNLDDMYFWQREIYVKLVADHNEKLMQQRREMEQQYGR